MDNMNFNNNDNNNDNIRPPDPIKQEQLIDNDFNYEYINPILQNYDDELNKALELSKTEFDLLQETQVFEFIQNEEKQRKNEFNSIKQKLNKILLFDRINSGKYQNILSIIEIYEQGYINEYKSTIEEFNEINKLLKTIRLTNDELESIKKIIVYKEE